MINIKKTNSFLKLFDNDQEVGHLEYTLAADEAQIINIFIEKEHRRKGFASQLLKDFIDSLEKKYSYIILEVRQSNTSATKLYQKDQVEKIDQRKNYY